MEEKYTKREIHLPSGGGGLKPAEENFISAILKPSKS